MQKKLSFLVTFIILISAFAAPSHAACGLEDFFKSKTLDLAKVNLSEKKQRLYFHQESKNCASGICPTQAYLLSGDEVLSVPSLDADWACSIYVSQKGKATMGWLAKSSLKQEVNPQVKSSLLQGQWLYHNSNNQNTLQIENTSDQQLSLQANLLWFANQEALKSGSFHDGSFSAKVPSALETWKYQGEGALPSSSCEVEGHWIYPYLLVKDNKNCGALNVTAQGIYRKASSI